MSTRASEIGMITPYFFPRSLAGMGGEEIAINDRETVERGNGLGRCGPAARAWQKPTSR